MESFLSGLAWCVGATVGFLVVVLPAIAASVIACVIVARGGLALIDFLWPRKQGQTKDGY